MFWSTDTDSYLNLGGCWLVVPRLALSAGTYPKIGRENAKPPVFFCCPHLSFRPTFSHG